jgi:hypothetical protein
MPVERSAGGTSLIDALDRVFDKGVVVVDVLRLSTVGIVLVPRLARLVVAAVEAVDTHLGSESPRKQRRGGGRSSSRRVPGG